MLGLVQQFALVQQRRNPARISERNLRLVQGEAMLLQCTIWNRDTDSSPVNIGCAQPVLSLFPDLMGVTGACGWGWGSWCAGDYGWGYDNGVIPALQLAGTIPTDTSTGVMNFTIESGATAGIGGRYRMFIYDMCSETVLAQGIVQIEGSRYPTPGLLGINSATYVPNVITTEDGFPLQGETSTCPQVSVLDYFTLDTDVLQ
jgi:hypothetical protein